MKTALTFKMKNVIFNALKENDNKLSKDMSPLALKALESLKNWDGFMDVNSVGTSVFMVTNYHIMKHLLINELDEEYIRLYLNRIDQPPSVDGGAYNRLGVAYYKGDKETTLPVRWAEPTLAGWQRNT